MTTHSSRPGYIFLVSVLAIGTVAAATSLSLMLLGWAAEQNGVLLVESNQAFEYAQTCAERALKALREDANYAGNETITFSAGTCQIAAIGGSGNENRTVCVEGASGETIRRLELSLDRLLPSVIVGTWREAASFTLCL